MNLVERLVSRWHKEYTGKSEREEARWWLNAIADVLDREMRRDSARWLRFQATPGTQDDVSRHSTIPKSDSTESEK